MQKVYDNVQSILPDEQVRISSEKAEYAGFWVRLAAYVIDSMVVFAGLLIVRLVFLSVSVVIEGTIIGGNVLFDYTLKDIVLYGFQVLYFILCTYYAGTTVGKRALNLRVVGAREEKLTLFNVIYRETIGRFLSGVILGLGYLLVGIDKEKRGVHDILCDTRVIYGKRVKVYPVYQAAPVSSVPSLSPMQETQETPPVQQMPPVQQTSTVHPQPNIPAMPEGGYRFVRRRDVETENQEKEERDS